MLDRLVRLAGADLDEAVLDVAEIGLLDAEAVDAGVAARAGLLRARHYHRTKCAVSLADCFVVEVVSELSAKVATSDPHLLDICHEEGIPVVVLPGTTGHRWIPPAR